MFKWIKEIKTYHENKRNITRYTAFLLGEVASLVMNFNQSQKAVKEAGITNEELVELLKAVKGLDQKEIVSKLVDVIKAKDGK
jgi:NTP pyrophosphatase (non-canonical NTP hydrolase)